MADDDVILPPADTIRHNLEQKVKGGGPTGSPGPSTPDKPSKEQVLLKLMLILMELEACKRDKRMPPSGLLADAFALVSLYPGEFLNKLLEITKLAMEAAEIAAAAKIAVIVNEFKNDPLKAVLGLLCSDAAGKKTLETYNKIIKNINDPNAPRATLEEIIEMQEDISSDFKRAAREKAFDELEQLRSDPNERGLTESDNFKQAMQFVCNTHLLDKALTELHLSGPWMPFEEFARNNHQLVHDCTKTVCNRVQNAFQAGAEQINEIVQEVKTDIGEMKNATVQKVKQARAEVLEVTAVKKAEQEVSQPEVGKAVEEAFVIGDANNLFGGMAIKKPPARIRAKPSVETSVNTVSSPMATPVVQAKMPSNSHQH